MTEKFMEKGDDILIDEIEKMPEFDLSKVGEEKYDDNISATESETTEQTVSDKNKTSEISETEKPEDKQIEGKQTEVSGQTKVEKNLEEKVIKPSLLTELEPSGQIVSDDPKYKGKNVNDIIKMHQEAEKKLSEQGKELGELRTHLSKKEPTFDEIYANMTSNDLLTASQDLRIKLSEIDPVVEPDEYKKVNNLIARTEVLYSQKKTEELFKANLNSQQNNEFIEKTKKQMQELGILNDKSGNFNESEYYKVIESAKDYVGQDGRLTDACVYKSLIDNYGHEKVNKFFEFIGAEKTRKQLIESQKKVEESVRIDTSTSPESTVTGKRIKLLDLPEYEMQRYIDTLSDEEFNRLKKIIASKTKK